MMDGRNRPVATWLYCGATGIIIQIILGGITRLTGSGLSITEWQPLLGVLPPMDEKSWQHSFEAYKQIAQFKLVNPHFILSDYKSIFFWEWLHRNWARTLGIVFIAPFFVLVYQKKIDKALHIPLIILFLMGLLQGVIGWIMVKSGLNDTSTAVNDIRLAIHFITALILLCYTLWMAFKLSLTRLAIPNKPYLLRTTGIIFCLILLQMCYGALMAGSKAALAAPTWPDMNGFLIPPAMIHGDPASSYLLTVQFIHRLLAVLIALLICILYYRSSSWQTFPLLAYARKFSLALICTQVILGILTLLNSFNSSYQTFALLHQSTGILLLITLLFIFYSININRYPATLTGNNNQVIE